ncbi:sensor histidine kinase [Epidermidibacterium keratini]|uniref:histidine kinase n=1 Tax=Epidermidibacterium keratini TaxID=1891644 RepID=A0A7L4YK35_9ACTN|nr:ATP-binding protein [Epidermidibacterium keratini]QHB98906.1 sensor histidine kinase [Epidermidibacterium keratini]
MEALHSGGRRTGVRRTARGFVASVVGTLLVPALVIAILTVPLSMTPARAVAGWSARRLAWVEGTSRDARPVGGRLIALLAIESLLGLLSACILALIVMGLVVAGQMFVGAAAGTAVSIFDAEPGAVTWPIVAAYALPGAFLLFLAASGLAGIAWIDRQAWTSLARPGVGELTREVSRLHGTLDDVVAAVDAERRRIERDIHDGVQQRVVALSIILARAERAGDAEERRELSQRARNETQHVLDDLRAVAWRTYPAMLVRDGLPAALEALCGRTETPIRLRLDMPHLNDRAAEAAAYFVISEAVTNVIKHADASRIDIDVTQRGQHLVLSVRDDGRGGAEPTGPGLSGIASRAAARGGHLHVQSPPGGPTTIEAVIPCG